MQPNERLVFFDLETGGLDPLRHPIIQFAGIAVDGQWRELEAIEIKIHFDVSTAEPDALEKNHYSRELWAVSAISQPRALERVGDFFRRHATMDKTSARGKAYAVARLAGHNAERFDCPFLVAWFKAANQFCPAACFEPLDTVSLARWASFVAPTQPKDHKLGSLCEWLGVPHEDAHDALWDVRATVQVARVLTERFGLGWRLSQIAEALEGGAPPKGLQAFVRFGKEIAGSVVDCYVDDAGEEWVPLSQARDAARRAIHGEEVSHV